MPRKRLDPETLRVIEEGEKLKGLIEHPGWSVAKEKLLQNLNNIENIQTIDFSNVSLQNPVGIIADLQGRLASSIIVRQWLNEIEGTVEQHTTNVGANKKEQDEFIFRSE